MPPYMAHCCGTLWLFMSTQSIRIPNVCSRSAFFKFAGRNGRCSRQKATSAKGKGSELACCGAYMKVNLQAQAGVGSMTEAADMGSSLPSWRAARTAARIWCLRAARRNAGVGTEDERSA